MDLTLDLTIVVAVLVVSSLCVWTLMKAARIADDEDERTAHMLVRHMEDTDWRWPR